MSRNIFVFYCFLAPVLFLDLPVQLLAQDSAGQKNGNSSESTLNRLIEISMRLSTLNEKLSLELEDSRKSSRELLTMLETSRKEFETLKIELEVLRISSMELSKLAENSQTELTALQEALRKAALSLTSLELSFTLYREKAEKIISGLNRDKKIWKFGCIAAGVLSAGLGTLLIVGR